MSEQKKIEHVIEIFADIIDSASDIDVAVTRKNGYVLLIDGTHYGSIRTGREMCELCCTKLKLSFGYPKT